MQILIDFQDPFEMDYNVARCVTKDGLYTVSLSYMTSLFTVVTLVFQIRGEFMRASRVLATRPERAIVALAELCEERKDEELVVAPPYQPRQPSLPPQTPYTVGSQTLRPKVEERFSPPAQFFEPGPRQVIQPVTIRPPPEHMAPKRSKWTSPPPPEASSADHTLFENQLGMGLQLATSSTEAREQDLAYNSSESNSEVFTDEGSDAAEDDIKSVRSYTEGSPNISSGPLRRPSWYAHETVRAMPALPLSSGHSSRSSSSTRGRFIRPPEQMEPSPPTAYRTPAEFIPSSRFDSSRRSSSGPPARCLKVSPLSSNTPLAVATPLPPSPESPNEQKVSDSSNVFYQTTTTRSPRPTTLYPNSGAHSSLLARYQSQAGYIIPVPHDIIPSNLPPSLSSLNPRAGLGTHGRSPFGGPDTPTPTSYHSLHSHSLSTSTITTTRTPPPRLAKSSPRPSQGSAGSSPLTSHFEPPSLRQQTSSRNSNRSIHHSHMDTPSPHIPSSTLVSVSPQPSAGNNSTSSTGSSPTPSSNGYSTSISRSPSPQSPSPPVTAVPAKLHQNVKDQQEDEAIFQSSLSGLTIKDGDTEIKDHEGRRGILVDLEAAKENES